jgi:dihydropteroate synthase
MSLQIHFSDGGEYTDDESHRTHIDVLIEHGAHVIDVGAESTRPGAQEVPPSEELRRLAPVFDFVSNCDADILFSIDTRHHEVAVSALDVGFQIVNDISAGAFDSKMVNTVKEHGALFIAMHSRGTPETMKDLAVL